MIIPWWIWLLLCLGAGAFIALIAVLFYFINLLVHFMDGF